MSVVYSGGFYPWQNPRPFLEAAAAKLDEIDRATLHIFGGPHGGLPNEGEVKDFLGRLQSRRCVRYHGYRPVEELVDTLSSAWCALELMEQNIERELAITGRTVEFLTSGTPVIYNNYSVLSDLIERYKAGWTVPTSNPAALGPVIEALRIGGPALVEKLSRNARELASAEFNAEKNMEPLVNLCGGPISKRASSAGPSRRAAVAVQGTKSIGKVLGISPDTFALVELRVNNPLRALQRQGLIGGFETTGIRFERLKEDRSFYEAAMIQRTVPRSIYQTLTNLGLPFLLDLDDNLLASASYRHEASAEVEVVAGLRHARVITTPNPRLVRMLEKYSGLPLSRKAYMTPNALPFPELTREPSQPAKIFWIQSDIAALAASRENVVRAVEDFSRRHTLPIVLIGPNVIERPKFTNQVVMGSIDFSSNLQLLEFSPTSIGVAPLETSADEQTLDFVAGKSDLKMLLFAGYGHPGVCSASPPYTDSPYQGGSIITGNSYAEWTEALEYQHREGWRSLREHTNRIQAERHIDRVASENWLPALQACVFPKPIRGYELYEAFTSACKMQQTPEQSIAYMLGNPDVRKQFVMAGTGRTAWNHYTKHGHSEDRRLLHDAEAHRQLLAEMEREIAELAEQGFDNGVHGMLPHFDTAIELSSLVQRLQSEIVALRESYSWKITAPLRRLAAPIMERRRNST